MEMVSTIHESQQQPGMYELSDNDVAAVSGGNILKRFAGAIFKAGVWVGRKWHDHSCQSC